MSLAVCRICLRSGFERTQDIDEKLLDFHDELCDYDVYQNAAFTFCLVCEYQLRKFYNFRQKCWRAHKILKSYKKKKISLGNLQELMPRPSIGFLTATDRQQVYYHYQQTSLMQSLSVAHNFVECGGHTDIRPEDDITIKHEDHEPETETEDATYTDNIKIDISENNILSSIQDIQNDFETSSVKDEFSIDEEYLDSDLDDEEYKSKSVKSTKTEVQTKRNQTNMMPSEVQHIQDGLDLSSVKDECFYDVSVAGDLDNEEYQSKSVKRTKTKVQTKRNKTNMTASEVINIQDKQDDLETSSVKDECSYNDSLAIDLDDEEFKSKSVKRTKVQTKQKKTNKAASEVISIDDLKLLAKKARIDKKALKNNIRTFELRDRIVQLLEGGNLDLGENVVMSKEVFLGMFDKCDKSRLLLRGVLKRGPGETAKVKKFLLYLLKRYNPEYESVFHIEYLTTRDMKVAEYEARKRRQEYVAAEFRCERCYKVFERPGLLDYHNKWHEPARSNACDICSMRFLSRKQLNVHCRSSHYSVYRCKLCAIVIYDFDSMLNHYHQHKGVRYTCDVCLGEYSSKSTLNTHRLTHATHACVQCARSFVSEQGLNNHYKLKHRVPESTDTSEHVSCDKCDATFKSRDVLRKHERQTHDAGKRLYKCLFKSCMESFSSAVELRAHARASGHVRRGAGASPGVFTRSRGSRRPGPARVPRVRVTGPDKPYRTCPICQEKVLNKSSTSLYSHHVTSHPTEPYAWADARDSLCEQCGKSFVHVSTYRDHLNTHSGAKPYACRECGKHFHMRRSLYLHRERHRPPRHQCKDCGKMFCTSANLLTHRRTHIGDRRFKCEICFKGFLHAYALKEHVKGVHNQIRRLKRPARKQTPHS